MNGYNWFKDGTGAHVEPESRRAAEHARRRRDALAATTCGHCGAHSTTQPAGSICHACARGLLR